MNSVSDKKDTTIWPAMPDVEEIVCWSRMQSEAGQSLDCIIERKETERRAGDGFFMWGVGNAPAVIANILARQRRPVAAVFSVMKSKPKNTDTTPEQTLAWRRYRDMNGTERGVPENVVITSRGGVTKRAHYALMCRSTVPLKLIRGGAKFDPSAYRNASGTGGNVGASQVTALLRRVREDSASAEYEVNMKVALAESYWVRLSDPVELPQFKQNILKQSGDVSVTDWLRVADLMRQGKPLRFAEHETELLL